MVIDRADNVVNICEMKFSTDKYEITKQDDENLRHKAASFIEFSKSRKSPHLVMVTPYGITNGMYRFSVQKVIKLNDFFA